MSGDPQVPLRLAGVAKSLAGRQVLHAVGFDCPAGSVTALLGPNGAGKTTCVDIAAGLRRVDRGRVSVLGVRPHERAARTALSLVPQEIGFPAAVRVRQCLDFVAGQRPDSGRTPPATELLERLGLAEVAHRRTGGLSGGQRRKLAISLALVHAPPVLVLDEATTNLDEPSRATTWQLVRDYAARGGAALVTSHILADIDAHADRVVTLNEGRVVLQDSVANVRRELGGSVVTVRPSRCRREAVLAGVRRAGFAAAASGRHAGTLSWRCAHPARLVALLYALDPAATDLAVHPVPLRDVLDELMAAAS